MFDFWIHQFFKAWLHGGRVPLLTKLPSGRANFSYYVSLENALRRLRAGHGNLFSWGTHLPEVPLEGAIFLPCKRFVPARNHHSGESFRRYDLPGEVNITH